MPDFTLEEGFREQEWGKKVGPIAWFEDTTITVDSRSKAVQWFKENRPSVMRGMWRVRKAKERNYR